jgi:hypothetical protein
MRDCWRFLLPLAFVGVFFVLRCQRDAEADNAAKMARPTREYDEVITRFPSPHTRPVD